MAMIRSVRLRGVVLMLVIAGAGLLTTPGEGQGQGPVSNPRLALFRPPADHATVLEYTLTVYHSPDLAGVGGFSLGRPPLLPSGELSVDLRAPRFLALFVDHAPNERFVLQVFAVNAYGVTGSNLSNEFRVTRRRRE